MKEPTIFSALKSLPRGPWVASQQYGFRFILSQDNEIVFKCGGLPYDLVKEMTGAANKWMADHQTSRPVDGKGFIKSP